MTMMSAAAAASASAAAHNVEAVVIGAGVIGIAVARALAISGKEVLILDRGPAIGSETSSRNSEVIHAGLYYPPASLKARFCVKGRNMLYEYCDSRNISYNKCGKIIIATNNSQWKTDVPRLEQQALQNGVKDVRLISSDDVRQLEPEVRCVGGLWSPSTGVVDSHSFMVSMLADAEDHGATLALHSTVDAGNVSDEGKLQLCVGGMWLTCGVVVNCAGLWAHKIAAMLHDRGAWRPPSQYFAKGNYFRLEGMKPPFRRLVYPVPEPGGLGVHATMDWSGLTVRFGPDVEWLDPSVDPEDIILDVDPRRADAFYAEVQKYWPRLESDTLVPDYAGIRPKLHHPDIAQVGNTTSSFVDFTIASPKDHGVPGLVHLFGIESPGLTSSLAIANHISQSILSDR